MSLSDVLLVSDSWMKWNMTICIDSHAYTAATSVLQSYFYLAIASSTVIPLLRFFLNKNSAFHKKAVINTSHLLFFSPNFLKWCRRNSTLRRARFFLTFMETLSCGWLKERYSRMATWNHARQSLTVLLPTELQMLDKVYFLGPKKQHD